MKTFKLINGEKEIVFNFPTSIKEINEDYLKNITDNIVVADNYVLVCLVYHERLGNLILARKQSKKGITSGVTPIFIKAGDENNKFVKSMSIKNKLIIPTSQLMLAQHVIVPNNTLSVDCFINYLDKDNTVATRYNNKYGDEECYLIEFKLVPSCDIIGFYSSDKLTYVTNPYFEVISGEK